MEELSSEAEALSLDDVEKIAATMASIHNGTRLKMVDQIMQVQADIAQLSSKMRDVQERLEYVQNPWAQQRASHSTRVKVPMNSRQALSHCTP
jgi:hypothetical protein